MPLEERRQIGQWLRHETALGQEQRDEQPADAAVAVDERVDRLELVVHERRLHEHRGMLLVEKPLPRVQALIHLLDRGRNECRLVEGAARRSDPVLRAAKLARRRVRTAPHQDAVHLSAEAKTQRKGRKHLEPVVDGRDVVCDFPHVGRGRRGLRCGFEEEEVGVRCVRALDARRQDGLTPQEWTDEHQRVRQLPACAFEAANRMASLFNERREGAEIQLRRQRVGYEGPVVSWRSDDPAGRSGAESLR